MVSIFYNMTTESHLVSELYATDNKQSAVFISEINNNGPHQRDAYEFWLLLKARSFRSVGKTEQMLKYYEYLKTCVGYNK